MKNLFCILIFLISTSQLFCQELNNYSREFGVNIIPALVIASGGEYPYNEIEIFYREKLTNKQLRFGLIYNNRNLYSQELIVSNLIIDNAMDSLVYHTSEYSPNPSYQLKIGLVWLKPMSRMEIYYGLDLHLGIQRGITRTLERLIRFNEEEIQPITRLNNSTFHLGMTPLIGSKVELTNRTAFGVEFGIPLYYLFKDVEYVDGSNEIKEGGFSQFNLSLNRLVNSIYFSINF